MDQVHTKLSGQLAGWLGEAMFKVPLDGMILAPPHSVTATTNVLHKNEYKQDSQRDYTYVTDDITHLQKKPFKVSKTAKLLLLKAVAGHYW